MFGEGILGLSDILLCVGACIFLPLAFAAAIMTSIFFPALRGVALGSVAGLTTYLIFGFLFGDTVGLLVATFVLVWVVINQRYITINRQSLGRFEVFTASSNRRQKKREPYIEIIPPSDRE